MATRFQSSEVVKRICEKQALVQSVIDKQNNLGRSALHYAAGNNNTEIAKILLNHNASVTIEDIEGYTPVHTSCKYGREEVLQLMLKQPAEIVTELMTKVTHDEKTPLLVAKSAVNYSLCNIQTLIKAGSEISVVDIYKNSILHLYSAEDDTSAYDDILDKDDSLLSSTNCNLETPLHIAASYGHSDTCFYFMEK